MNIRFVLDLSSGPFRRNGRLVDGLISKVNGLFKGGVHSALSEYFVFLLCSEMLGEENGILDDFLAEFESLFSIINGFLVLGILGKNSAYLQ